MTETPERVHDEMGVPPPRREAADDARGGAQCPEIPSGEAVLYVRRGRWSAAFQPAPARPGAEAGAGASATDRQANAFPVVGPFVGLIVAPQTPRRLGDFRDVFLAAKKMRPTRPAPGEKNDAMAGAGHGSAYRSVSGSACRSVSGSVRNGSVCRSARI